ncbi:MAG: hypothetical protein HY807_09395 [Nitrospirae bacterium]|nr:hypothetical protein [Nitrospirota bacterium]
MAIIALIGGGWAVIDMLCCKEILLYKNCIVKRWHIFGERKVDFNTAMLDGVSSRHFPYPVSIKKFRKTDTYFLLGLIKGCFYNELLANAKDVKEMNRLLAKVTGREVAEFEKGSINNELPRSRAERGIKNLLLKQD